MSKIDLTNRISGSQKMASPRFHAYSFVCNNQEAEINKIKKPTQRGFYFTFNALLKYFNTFKVFQYISSARYKTLLQKNSGF